MTRLCIIPLAIVCLVIYQETYAELRNGYDIELIKAAHWIHNLKEITQEVLSTAQRMKVEKRLEIAYASEGKLRENHAKTQELIEMLRMIDPELYHEINTIQDSEGNETDVYIKVVDHLGPDLRGATNVDHSVDNPNVYSSEYGDYTVSIKLITTGPIWPLWILVHELGHVLYQVPHLAEYTAFYQKVYQDQYFAGVQGHHPNDPSYHSMQATSKAFKKSWKEYNREIKWMAKDKSRKMLVTTQRK
jgi:hypothetical protein